MKSKTRSRTRGSISQAVLLSVLTLILLIPTGCLLCIQDICAMSLSRQRLSEPEQAEAFVMTLLGEEADSLTGAYELTPDMEEAVKVSGGWEGLAKSLSVLGKLVSAGPTYAATWRGRNVLRVPCTFSLAQADLVFVLEDGAIAGLVTDVYTGSQESSAEESSAEETPTEESATEESSLEERPREETPEEEPGDKASADEIEEKPYTELSLSVPLPSPQSDLPAGKSQSELPGELPGTLTLPEGDGPFPAIVLVHGSGPSDRDETIMSLKPFKDLAEGLARKGIAVYRYDKRTYVYGKEMMGDCRITLMEETVEDAANAVRLAAGQEKIDPAKVLVLGHSLGALAVPAMAQLCSSVVSVRSTPMPSPSSWSTASCATCRRRVPRSTMATTPT